jgi:hypothetical protein
MLGTQGTGSGGVSLPEFSSLLGKVSLAQRTACVMLEHSEEGDRVGRVQQAARDLFQTDEETEAWMGKDDISKVHVLRKHAHPSKKRCLDKV